MCPQLVWPWLNKEWLFWQLVDAMSSNGNGLKMESITDVPTQSSVVHLPHSNILALNMINVSQSLPSLFHLNTNLWIEYNLEWSRFNLIRIDRFLSRTSPEAPFNKEREKKKIKEVIKRKADNKKKSRTRKRKISNRFSPSEKKSESSDADPPYRWK